VPKDRGGFLQVAVSEAPTRKSAHRHVTAWALQIQPKDFWGPIRLGECFGDLEKIEKDSMRNRFQRGSLSNLRSRLPDWLS
jgi:hypothetical protein